MSITEVQARDAKESLSEVYVGDEIGHVMNVRNTASGLRITVELRDTTRKTLPAEDVTLSTTGMLVLLKHAREEGKRHPSDCVKCENDGHPGHNYYPPNTPDTYGPYHAFNGHTMESHATGYGRDGRLDYSQTSAWCVEGCGACAGGEALPDW